MRPLRISNIIAIALVSSIFAEQAAWAAGGLDNCHCKGKARSNPGDCLAPETQMDVEAQAEGAPQEPQEKQDFRAAFVAIGLTEVLRQLNSSTELWDIAAIGGLLGFIYYTLFDLLYKARQSGRLSKASFRVGALILTAMFLRTLVRANLVDNEIGLNGIVPAKYKAGFLLFGIWLGTFLRLILEGPINRVFSKPIRYLTEKEDEQRREVILPLWGWGSGVNSVILERGVEDLNWVSIPDRQRQHLRILALGFSKSEMKEWAGPLMDKFEGKGHTVKRLILPEREANRFVSTVRGALSDFKPHVVIVPHSSDAREEVQDLGRIVRVNLAHHAQGEGASFVIIEQETRSHWIDSIKRLRAQNPELKDGEIIEMVQRSLEKDFDTYLHYRSVKEWITTFMWVVLPAMPFTNDLIRRWNARSGMESILKKGAAPRTPSRLIKELGGDFALRFRATRIVAKQANQGPGEVTRTRIGGRQERRIEELLFGQVALQEAM